MKNIAISTAAFCLWGITPQEKLDYCRQLQFSEIEIALSTERMVRDYLTFLEGAENLPHFRRIAIHAPWHRVSYGHNRGSSRVLKDLALIAERLPVAEFIFHMDRIEEVEALVRWGRPVCLENAHGEGAHETLRQILHQTGFSLALNVNRGARHPHQLEEIIREFRHRVSRIHVSGYDGRHGRMPILMAEQLPVLEKVRGIAAPIVLEGLFAPCDVNAIIRERQAVAQTLEAVRREATPGSTICDGQIIC